MAWKELAGAEEAFTLTLEELGIYLECTLQKGFKNLEVEGRSEGTVQFDECEAYDFTGEPAGCEIAPITSKVEAKLIKMGATHYTKFTPAEANLFATIVPTECLIPEFEVTGSVCGDAPGGSLEGQKEIQVLTISEATATGCGSELLAGEEEAILAGKSEFDLPGWKTWGFH